MRYLSFVLLCGLLAGCAGNVVVKMPLQEAQGQTLLARVKVNDLRAPGVAASTREAAFGTPMGNITFDPPEKTIIQNYLEVELTRLLRAQGVQTPQAYVCDIVEFGVNTRTTPLYWDVMGRIRLVLKHDDEQYKLAGTHIERTYLWPGAATIRQVTDIALQQIGIGLAEVVQSPVQK